MTSSYKKNNIASVSVVIPCFRNADTIQRAIKSVADQTMRPQEVIIVDDASDDDSLKILEALQRDFGDGWLRIIPLPVNCGPAIARNTGWDAATQPYIAFLDADDSWHPLKIAYQYSFMEAHPEVALSGHLTLVKTTEISSYEPISQPTAASITPNRMFFSNPFTTPSIILRNTSHYRFRERQYHMEDYLLWLQIYLDGNSVYILNAPLAYLHKPFGSDGLSADTWNMQKANLKNWWILFGEKRLSLTLTLGLCFLSLLKWFRRIAINKSKKLFRHRKTR